MFTAKRYIVSIFTHLPYESMWLKNGTETNQLVLKCFLANSFLTLLKLSGVIPK